MEILPAEAEAAQHLAGLSLVGVSPFTLKLLLQRTVLLQSPINLIRVSHIGLKLG